MKTGFKVLGAIFALGTVVLLLLHVFLQHGLTKAMREVVLPRVKQKTGIDVRVERLSINVAAGHLYLKGVAVRNPDGFLVDDLVSVGLVDVEVDVMSLFKQKPIRVKHLTVEDSLVNIVRNVDGVLNIDVVQEGLPTKPSTPSDPSGNPAVPKPGEPEPLPEILIEQINCLAKVRYVDMRFDAVDLMLALALDGHGLGTIRDADAEWGELLLKGSLGGDKTRFITDLQLDLAQVADPQSLSFDLAGRIMEIDPKIMGKVYDSLGIRSAPFGFDPDLHCRDNRFAQSSFALNLKHIQLEDKLADKLGGMGSIDSLRFPVPVEGTLQEPSVNVQDALVKALGGNTRSLLNAFLRGAAAKETGAEEPPDSLSDAAVEILGDKVDEIGKNEALKKDLKDIGRKLFGK